MTVVEVTIEVTFVGHISLRHWSRESSQCISSAHHALMKGFRCDCLVGEGSNHDDALCLTVAATGGAAGGLGGLKLANLAKSTL